MTHKIQRKAGSSPTHAPRLLAKGQGIQLKVFTYYLCGIRIKSMFCFFGMQLPGGRGFLSRGFGCGSSKGAVGTLRRMSGARWGTVAVLGALNVTHLALKDKELLFASQSRVRDDMENPTYLLVFVIFRTWPTCMY